MLAIPVWLTTRLVVSLLVGIVVAKILKKFIRVLITKCMPLKQRMAPDFFPKLTKISTVVGIFITLGVAIPTYVGLGKTSQWFGISEKQEILSLSPIQQPARNPPTVIAPPVTNTPSEYETTTPLEKPISASSAPVVEPKPKANKYAGICYLQVNAFTQLDNARQEKNHWQTKTQQPVFIAYINTQKEPYKVILGPFHSLEEARRYRKRKGFRGFPRSVLPQDLL